MVSDDLYNGLRGIPSLLLLPDAKGVEGLGLLVDSSWDRRDLSATERAIVLATELLGSHRYTTLANHLKVDLHYFLANAWYSKDHIASRSGGGTWDWHSEPLEQQILHLRTALTLHASSPRRCQILTNLGNALSHVGRPVDAIDCYDRAISLAPRYGMPVGNRGLALQAYAYALSDPGHTVFMLREAASSLRHAAQLPVDGPDTAQRFAHAEAEIRARVKGCRLRRWVVSQLGRTVRERQYRSWALRERLFLNPLNDVRALPIAAHDPLSPGSIVTNVGEGPHLFSFFNSLKQEFVSARFIIYQGLNREGLHFSGRDVKISDTMNYEVHRLGIEEVKFGFRACYSLLDKIAVLINAYFRVGLDPGKVKFREVWYERREKGVPRRLRPEFADRPNLPLRGLFWLSKDLAAERRDHHAVLAPDAQDLVEVRNCLEHKYLCIANGVGSIYKDPLARIIDVEDFKQKAVRIVKHTRTALIQLACAIAAEERTRAKDRTGLAPSMLLVDRPDKEKQK